MHVGHLENGFQPAKPWHQLCAPAASCLSHGEPDRSVVHAWRRSNCGQGEFVRSGVRKPSV